MSIALQKTSLQRIAWKENYLLRPIVVANLVLLLFVLISICVTTEPAKAQFAGEMFLNTFILFGCIVGLATGIVLFVPERETETDLLLGRLPIFGDQVSRRKLRQGAFWFVLFLVAAAVLSVATFALSYGDSLFQLQQHTYMFYVMSIVIPVECFLWSVVCSMKFRKSIVAVIVAAIACVLGLALLGPIAVQTAVYFAATQFLSQETENAIYLLSQAFLILTLAMIAWQSSRTWLRGRVESDSKPVDAVQTLNASSKSDSFPKIDPRPSYPYASLLWQSFRMQRIPFAILALGAIVVAAFTGWYLWTCASEQYNARYEMYYSLFATVNFLWILTGAATGMLSFAGDQSNRSFLFFQQQADYPDRVWISRIATIGLMLPVVFIAAAFAYIPLQVGLSTWKENSNLYGGSQSSEIEVINFIQFACSIRGAVWIFLLSAAVAQLISILIRWSVVAFFAVAIVSIMLAMYCNYIISLGEPLWIFTWPIILVCLAASWLFAPKWISERKQKRSTAICSLLAVGAIVASFAALIWHRANVFPEPKFIHQYAVTFENYGSGPNSIETKYEPVLQLKEAYSKLKPAKDLAVEMQLEESNVKGGFRTADVKSWPEEFLLRYVETNRESIELIQSAVVDPDSVHFLHPSSSSERNVQASRIAAALDAKVAFQMQNGTLEESLDAIVAETKAAWNTGVDGFWTLDPQILRFVDWAERPDQTPESIRNGIKTLDALQRSIFDRKSDRIFRERYYAIERYYGDSDPRESVQLKKNPPGPVAMFGLTWWELQRSRRIVLTDLEESQNAWKQLCMIANKSDQRAIDLRSNVFRTIRFSDERTVIGDWISPLAFATPLINAFRYTKVRLALEGYRLENDSYPESQQDLIGGNAENWLPRLPCDVATGQPFAYSQSGLDDRVFYSPVPLFYVNGWRRELYTRESQADSFIDPNTPFLLPWSGLPVEKKIFTVRAEHDDSNEMENENDLKTGQFSGYWMPWTYVPGERPTSSIGDVERWKLKPD